MPKGRRWTPAEDARLADLVATGANIAAIAEAMDRTEDSIDSRMRDNKLRLKRPPRGFQQAPNWTPSQDAYVLEALARREPLSVTAEKLGRTWQGVKRRREALRRPPVTTEGGGVVKRCLRCDTEFVRKPGEKFFMCDEHRHASASPYEPGCGGNTGRQVRVGRAA